MLLPSIREYHDVIGVAARQKSCTYPASTSWLIRWLQVRPPLTRLKAGSFVYILSAFGGGESRLLLRSLGEWNLPVALPDLDSSAVLFVAGVLKKMVDDRLRLV